MDTDILTIRIDHAADPDGAHLHALLAAELAYERARSMRQRWLGALVCAGIVALIVRALGIDADSPWPTAFTAAALAVFALRTALAVLVERHCRRRWSAALDDHPGAALRSPKDC